MQIYDRRVVRGGSQAGVYAMQFWMPPTYLRIVPGLIRLKHRRLP